MPEYSDKQLKISIWWVTHRYQLKKWWVIVLAVADLLVFLYILFASIVLLYTWNKYVAIPSQISQSYINFTAYQQANAPQNIQVVSTVMVPVPGQTQTYHLVADVKNPNAKWMAGNLQYHFVLDGVDLDTGDTFLLPQEERFIFKYSVKSTSQKPTAQLVIDNPGWKRIEFPLEKPALNFEINDAKVDYLPIQGERGTYTSFSTRVSANIKNNTVYNFWQVNFQVVLFSGDRPVAINEIKFDRFGALASKELGISWSDEYRSITNVKIVPEVNAYDPEMLYSPDEF
ncbi:MAG: hypothetical protein WC693_01105 [Patescibacteria group bacterium]|jgi:hypothetical protein